MQNVSFTTHDLISFFYEPSLSKILSPEQWQTLILILRYERLLATFSFFYRSSNSWNDLPDFVKHHLINAEIMSQRQAKQVVFEADQLRDLLEKEAPEFLFLKGAAYTLTNNPASVGRTFSDIDILVKKETIPELEKSLLFKGWISQPVNDYDENYYREWTHEIPPMVHSARGTVIDVHHNLIPPVSGRAPDITEFVNYREVVNGFAVLSPPAMLLHSSIHLMFNEDFKQSFRDLFDIKAISENYGGDTFWKESVDLALRTGFYKELFLALRYASRRLPFTLPDLIANNVPYSRFKLALLDWIFDRALAPSHPTCEVAGQKFAFFLAWCRGHWCKMPLHILLYHFSVKGTRGIAESIFGKHIFVKNENNKTNINN